MPRKRKSSGPAPAAKRPRLSTIAETAVDEPDPPDYIVFATILVQHPNTWVKLKNGGTKPIKGETMGAGPIKIIAGDSYDALIANIATAVRKPITCLLLPSICWRRPPPKSLLTPLIDEIGMEALHNELSRKVSQIVIEMPPPLLVPPGFYVSPHPITYLQY